MKSALGMFALLKPPPEDVFMGFGERKDDRQRETSIRCPCTWPPRGPGPPPRHVSWPSGTQDDAPTNWATWLGSWSLLKMPVVPPPPSRHRSVRVLPVPFCALSFACTRICAHSSPVFIYMGSSYPYYLLVYSFFILYCIMRDLKTSLYVSLPHIYIFKDYI